MPVPIGGHALFFCLALRQRGMMRYNLGTVQKQKVSYAERLEHALVKIIQQPGASSYPFATSSTAPASCAASRSAAR